ncbi:MAG TPA: hypothetical protein VG755_27950 [Nannocystaceae bacterium]|nr:hypothetical protein [Nannocystaceae bacterium]
MLTLGALVAFGCKGVDKGKRGGRTVKASIQAFDPNADIGFEFGDGGGEGGETPDDFTVRSEFEKSLPGVDQCVADYKTRKGMKAEKQLEGDVSLSVKLNPKHSQPLGINASISSKHDKDDSLKTCIKEAIDRAAFPTYNGMPRIVDFTFELDPGSEWVDE